MRLTWSCPYPNCDAIQFDTEGVPDCCPQCLRDPRMADTSFPIGAIVNTLQRDVWYQCQQCSEVYGRDWVLRVNGCPNCGHDRFMTYRNDKGEPIKPPGQTSILHQDYYSWHPVAECKDIIAPFPFNLGAAIKYIWRAGRKDKTKQIEDLKKAIHHLEFEIVRIEASDDQA